MKKTVLFLLCLSMLFLCACDNGSTDPINNTASDNNAATYDNATVTYEAKEQTSYILEGVWVCDDISKDCYFIFKNNGDAFAKMGTCTVYGTFDADANAPDKFDIDLGEFFYNEYTAVLSNQTLTLKSDESEFKLKKATAPQISAGTPDKSKIDTALVGDWQAEDSFECFRFNSDGTAVITDMYDYATVDCVYECKDGTVTLKYMASETISDKREYKYSQKEDGSMVIGDHTYEKLQTEQSAQQ